MYLCSLSERSHVATFSTAKSKSSSSFFTLPLFPAGGDDDPLLPLAPERAGVRAERTRLRKLKKTKMGGQEV